MVQIVIKKGDGVVQQYLVLKEILDEFVVMGNEFKMIMEIVVKTLKIFVILKL